MTAHFFQQFRIYLTNIQHWMGQKCNSYKTVGVSTTQSLVNYSSENTDPTLHSFTQALEFQLKKK